MKVKIARQDVYIPEWKNNKKLPEAEQVKVEFSYMTAEQEEKFSTIVPKYKGTETSNMNVEVEIHTNANAIWDECVKKVIGLFDEDTGKEITDPKKVRGIPGIYGLITDVVAYIKRGIEEEEVKN